MSDEQETTRRAKAPRPEGVCSFSVVIAVLNEAGRINDLIEQIRSAQQHQSYEIIVVDGDPNGSTIKVITDESVITTVSETGRAKQMNAGAAIARGQVLIFLHADTQLPANAFERIETALRNKKYVAGAFDLGIDSKSRSIKFIAALARIRSRITRVPYGDQAIFIRRKYFSTIGRFKEISFMEDVELMKAIRKRRDRICILPQRVATSDRRWQREGVICTTLRNRMVMFLYWLGVHPCKLARFYRSSYDKGK